MVLTSFPGQFLEAEHLPHRLVFGKTHPSFAFHLNKSPQLSAFQNFQKTVPSSLIRHEPKQIDRIMQNHGFIESFGAILWLTGERAKPIRFSWSVYTVLTIANIDRVIPNWLRCCSEIILIHKGSVIEYHCHITLSIVNLKKSYLCFVCLPLFLYV